MPSSVDYIAGETFHGRRGAVENAFRYSIDYVMLDAEADDLKAPSLFGRNRRKLAALHDLDHGGVAKVGRGAIWAREVLAAHGLAEQTQGRLMLLAQPRLLGHVFNPVSFWLAYDEQERLRVVIAEVSNTFGDRHSYLCHREDLAEITRHDVLCAKKIFHVSPFQEIEGGYEFRFDIRADRVGIFIDYTTGHEGLYATLTGTRRSLRNRDILRALWRRPFGSRRVLGLIHWQALKLWIKGAPYRPRPEPPEREVS